MTGIGPRSPGQAGDGEVWLGDLLEDVSPLSSRPVRASRAEWLPWLGRWALHTVYLSMGATLVFLVAGLVPPFGLIVPASACLVLMFRAWRATVETEPGRTADLVRSANREWEWGSGLPDEDRMRDAVRRWNRRLEWGASDQGRFRVSVANHLAEVAAERMRQRHGFTPAQDPARARALLGEAGWEMLYGTGRVNPTVRELSALIARLENL